ncbi:MAG: hypothetical protein JWN00_1503 [Actinomycetia bacterium]|nr:hypothetical protein [Actinomycetes bacterium]
MNDPELRQALERIAGRAAPVDGLAEKAVRGSAVRRNAALAATAAGVAAAIAAVPLLLGSGTAATGRPVAAGLPTPKATTPGPSAAYPGLPANTRAELAIVKQCLNGPPSLPDTLPTPGGGGPVTPDYTSPGHRISDYRVLVTFRDATGTAAFLGSTVGHNVCFIEKDGATNALSKIPHQTANTWQGIGRKTRLGPFPGLVSIDDATGGIYADSTGKWPSNVPKSVADQWVITLAGRVKPQVARVTITWPTGKTTTAALSNGFFLARLLEPPRPNGDLRPSTIKTYDQNGKLLVTLRA